MPGVVALECCITTTSDAACLFWGQLALSSKVTHGEVSFPEVRSKWFQAAFKVVDHGKGVRDPPEETQLEKGGRSS